VCLAKRCIVSLDHRSYCVVIEHEHSRVVENLNNPSGSTCTRVYGVYDTRDVKICEIIQNEVSKKKIPTSEIIRHIITIERKN